MLTRNRIFPALFRHDSGDFADRRLFTLAAVRQVRAGSWLDVRWGKVRALRAAIVGGQYDLDGRLEDLLDDPPTEMAAWISQCGFRVSE